MYKHLQTDLETLFDSVGVTGLFGVIETLSFTHCSVVLALGNPVSSLHYIDYGHVDALKVVI